jgi:hypothetical protein
MDYAFRTFCRTDPPAPGPGELHLRPQSSSPQAGRRLACLAVEGGPDAFVRGEGPVRCLVIQSDPTLDDMLAALFLERRLSGKELPTGAKAFATYAALAREGLKPGDLPLQDSLAGVYLAVRKEAGRDLTEPEARGRFLADWSDLARRAMEAAEAGWNPFTRSLTADDPTFARARAFLARDRDVYTDQDHSRGERWLMMLPGGSGKPVAGLLLGSPPKSFLWKFWAREDPEAPGGRGYLFLAVFEDERHWRFSTDPVHRVSIRSLAHKLQTAEAARDAVRAAADPWFDGAGFDHTIIAAPRRGTLLSDAEVLAIVRRWGGVRPAPAPGAVPARRRLPVTAASLALGCAGVAALTWSLVWHRPKRAGALPPLPAPAMLVRVNTGPQVRATIVEDGTTTRARARADDQNFQPGFNQAVFITSRRVSEPVKLRVTFRFPEKEVPLEQVRVEVNGKESPPLSFEPGSAKELRSREVGAFFNGGDDNVVIVKADNPLEERVRVIVELGWQADLQCKRDLYLLAVGVSQYKYPQLNLRCAAADARDLVEALSGQEGPLFQTVHAEALTDKQVVKDDLIDRLVGLSKKVPPESLVLVTVSGHGKKLATTGRYFFLPYDYDPAKPPNARGVSWQDFQDCLTGFHCPVILVLDTCHSGAAGGGVRGEGEAAIPPKELADAVQKAAELWKGNRSGIVVMAACLGEEVAHEDADWGHGALTLALLEGIQGKRLYNGTARTPLPQQSAGPVITLQDLQDYATKRVQELAGDDQAVVVRCTDGIHPTRIPITVNRGAKRP